MHACYQRCYYILLEDANLSMHLLLVLLFKKSLVDK